MIRRWRRNSNPPIHNHWHLVGSHEVEVDGLVATFVVSAVELPAALSLVPPLTITPMLWLYLMRVWSGTVTVQNDGYESR